MTSHGESVAATADQLCYHGGIDRHELEQLGVDPEGMIDFSSNILDVRHPRAVIEALSDADAATYPDRGYQELREAIADRHRIDTSRVWVGNGASDLIHLVARTPFESKSVSILGPTFSEYERANRIAGNRVTRLDANEDEAFRHRTEQTSQLLEDEHQAAVWICNPNNPTGQVMDPAVIQNWVRTHPDTLFIVDESYQPFAENMESLVRYRAENLLVVRSMTKAFALAGVRLGYVVGGPERIVELISRSVPWSVSASAAAAGIAALCHELEFRGAIEEMRQRRNELQDHLRGRGYLPLASETNYFLLPVDDATAFRRELLNDGVLVRDCTSFGLPQFVRIAVRDNMSNELLLRAIDRRPIQPSHDPPLVSSAASQEPSTRLAGALCKRGAS